MALGGGRGISKDIDEPITWGQPSRTGSRGKLVYPARKAVAMRKPPIRFIYIVLIIAASAASPGRTLAQGKVDAKIPAFPAFDSYERRVLTNAAGHISRGQFDKATADLEP